jgi:hypothetical protein
MPVQFFPTQDPALLAQYFELRGRVYRRHYHTLTEDFGRREEADERSQIVVGFDGRVVSGGRITISRPGDHQRMPMEEAGFTLGCAFPEFGLDSRPYAEFSRVAVDPAYANGRRCGLGLIEALARRAAHSGVDLVFSICPEPMVRLNAINARKLRVRFRTFSKVPNPFGIPMTLCAYDGLIQALISDGSNAINQPLESRVGVQMPEEGIGMKPDGQRIAFFQADFEMPHGGVQIAHPQPARRDLARRNVPPGSLDALEPGDAPPRDSRLGAQARE